MLGETPRDTHRLRTCTKSKRNKAHKQHHCLRLLMSCRNRCTNACWCRKGRARIATQLNDRDKRSTAHHSCSAHASTSICDGCAHRVCYSLGEKASARCSRYLSMLHAPDVRTTHQPFSPAAGDQHHSPFTIHLQNSSSQTGVAVVSDAFTEPVNGVMLTQRCIQPTHHPSKVVVNMAWHVHRHRLYMA